MAYTKFHIPDRAAGALDSQLLSSQTSGTFTFSSLANLGSQSWQASTGYQVIVTIENEQILCSSLTVSSGTATATIATGGRGYGGTTAATHASTTAVYAHITNAHIEAIQTHLAKFDEAGLIKYVTYTPTITNASTHSVAGADVTSVFTAGRVYLFKVSGTWYRAIVRSSSFSTNTTINIDGDSLIASGTITEVGFEFSPSSNKPVDINLIKSVTAAPVNNPPSGYSWLWVRNGNWFTKYSDGTVRMLNAVEATASSSSGVLTLDWSLARVYDVTLTENITGVTHQNGVDGEKYVLRIKQHASAPKTVTMTGGKTRFSNSVASYAVSTTASDEDYLEFVYNNQSAADKYDLMLVMKGFKSSPTQYTAPIDTPTMSYDWWLNASNDLNVSYNPSYGMITATPTGNFLYMATKQSNTASTQIEVTRWARDTSSGCYYYDGTTLSSGSFNNSTNFYCGIVAGSTYVWVIGLNGGGTDIRIARYSQALTSEQVMTISGTANTSIGKACGDDSNLYVFGYNTGTAVIKYAISGTTATASSAFTSADTGANIFAPWFDGTDIHYHTGSVYKKYNVTGTLQSSLTHRFGRREYPVGITYKSATEIYHHWGTVYSWDGTSTTGKIFARSSTRL